MQRKELTINKLRIDPQLFELGFAKNATPNDCCGKCCRGGVYLSLDEKGKILENRELIKQYMDETQPINDDLWFANELIEDADFPNHVCDSTNVHNDKCVFLQKDNKCSLQSLALDKGFHKWSLKPLYCVAFPVVITNNELTFDDFLSGEAECCTAIKGLPISVIEACKEEFLHILGKDGYIKLTQFEKEYKESK